MYLVALALLCYAPSVGLPLLLMSFGCLAIALLNVTTVALSLLCYVTSIALPLHSNSILHLLPLLCSNVTF